MVDLVDSGLSETQRMILEISPHAKTTIYKADVSDDESVRNMINKCVATYGRVDFACNNAGIGMPDVKTTETDVKTFDKIHNVNYKGVRKSSIQPVATIFNCAKTLQVYLCQKYEVIAMLNQERLPGVDRAARGSIVNTASLSGVAVLGSLSAYHSSKHAVISMTRCDARQYGGQGIRINCICPGFVDTPMLRDPSMSKEFIEIAEAQCPMKRLISPAEIADGVAFLHGSGASAVTGIHLPVDGGALLFHVV